jgi:hypothetical protein
MLPSELLHFGHHFWFATRVAALTFLEWFAHRHAVVSLF